MTNDELAEQVGHRVRLKREREDIGKLELARRLGVDHSYVGLMESGKRLPSLRMLYSLAEQLGCTAKELLP